jgi:hypothetical protein
MTLDYPDDGASGGAYGWDHEVVDSILSSGYAFDHPSTYAWW